MARGVSTATLNLAQEKEEAAADRVEGGCVARGDGGVPIAGAISGGAVELEQETTKRSQTTKKLGRTLSREIEEKTG